MNDLQALSSYYRRMKPYKRGYEHQPFTNPYDGMPEAFAQGIYEAPGDLVSMLEGLGEFTTGQRTTRPASRYVNNLTQVNELGYNPNNYNGLQSLQGLARLSGNVIGDPLNAIPGGYVANKFGSRLADEIVGQSLKPGMSRQAGMVGYHGSPHKFDKFDHSQMGTGEGAQAYGWGTYIAENPEVAGSYQKALSGVKGTTTQSGSTFNLYKKGSDEFITPKNSKQRMVMQRLAESQGDFSHAIDKMEVDTMLSDKDFKSARNILKRWQKDGYEMRTAGNMYEVDLPDEKISQMLDWDAPLSEQPESVRRGVQQAIADAIEDGANGPNQMAGTVTNSKWDTQYVSPKDINNLDGASIKSMLQRVYGDQASAEKLNQLGIPGIKYFDGSSRSAGEGTRNFVVFDENDMNILSRNNEKITQPLPMDEASRMQRARDMGFDTDNVYYHGTGKDFEEFNTGAALGQRNTTGGDAYETVSLSSNPKQATEYAQLTTDNEYTPYNKFIRLKDEGKRQQVLDIAKKQGATDANSFNKLLDSKENPVINKILGVNENAPSIIPANIRGNMFEVDWGGDSYDNLRAGNIVREARAGGYDGVIHRNIDDRYAMEGDIISDTAQIFDPKNIRSKFAKFDPAKKNSANLLDSRLLPIPAGLLGYNALEQDN